MNLENFLKYKKNIDDELRLFLKLKQKEEGLDKFTKFVLNELNGFVLRDGKRLRPILVLIGYYLSSNKKDQPIPRNILKASISVELLHDFLLIHDDIIDCSNLRRSKPTMHKLIESKLKNEKLGKDVALIAGDILFSYCFSAVEKNITNGKKKEEIFKVFNKAITQTCVGEIQDIFLSSKQIETISEKTIKQFNSIKTTYYTIEAPLKIGALMASTTKKQLLDIEKISKPLGEAFQLKDDLIGLFGDEKVIGKSVTSDVEEGKKTLPITIAYKRADKKEKEFIKYCLGRKITKKEFEKLKEIVTKTNAKSYSYTKLNNLVKIGEKNIKSSSFTNEHKQILLELSNKWFK